MLTGTQVSALKYLIAHSRGASDLAKRILFFLLDRSNGLTEEVCFSISSEGVEYTEADVKQAGHTVGGMQSCNGTTYLNELTALSGSDFTFSVHSASAFGFVSYRFWLSRKYYSRTAQPLTMSRPELDKIDLTKPGLYPTLETDSRVTRSS